MAEQPLLLKSLGLSFRTGCGPLWTVLLTNGHPVVTQELVGPVRWQPAPHQSIWKACKERTICLWACPARGTCPSQTQLWKWLLTAEEGGLAEAVVGEEVGLAVVGGEVGVVGGRACHLLSSLRSWLLEIVSW